MKTILTLVLLLTVSATFAQLHYGFPVKELDTLAAARDTNTFYHHPIYLDVTVSQRNFSVNLLSVVTTYKESVDTTLFYTAKSTQTTALLVIPKIALDITTTVNADNSLNIQRLNGVLRLWGLQYDSKSPYQVVIPQ